MFEEIFKQELGSDASRQLEEAMKAFMTNEPELAQQMETLASAAATAETGLNIYKPCV